MLAGGLEPHSPDGVGRGTGAVLVTDETVEPRGTEPLLAVRALEACVTQTRPVDVVTLGPVLTVTPLAALGPVGTDGALVLAPGHGRMHTRRLHQ